MPRHPLEDENGVATIVAAFLGFRSARRAQRACRSWRRALRASLERRTPTTMRAFKHAESLREHSPNGFEFARALDLITWEPEACVMRVVMQNDDDASAYALRSVWLPTLAYLLRTRLPPDCYVLCSSRPSHDGVDIVRGNVVPRPDVTTPLMMSYCFLRSARELPRPALFAIPAHSLGSWERPPSVFDHEASMDVLSLPPEVDLKASLPSFFFLEEPIVGPPADGLLLKAWIDALFARYPLGNAGGTHVRSGLKSWFAHDPLTGFSSPGNLAGRPGDLRAVKWCLLVFDYIAQPATEMRSPMVSSWRQFLGAVLNSDAT